MVLRKRELDVVSLYPVSQDHLEGQTDPSSKKLEVGTGLLKS